MKRLFFLIVLGAAFVPAASLASVPSLKVAPLKFQESLVGPDTKIGYIDVSNPTDAAVTVKTSVQGMKQVNERGELAFFDDPALARGVTLASDTITLGPREAVRMPFSLDPRRLPQGGVYGAIFFQSTPTVSTVNANVVYQSVRVGSLLIIDNGGHGLKQGDLKARFGFLQFGSGLTGSVRYHNTGKAPKAIAFNPTIQTKVWPWGSWQYTTGPLVFPGNTRPFSVTKTGSYFGLLPVQVRDTATGRHHTVVVVAVTGWGRALLAILIIAALWLYLRWHKKKSGGKR